MREERQSAERRKGPLSSPAALDADGWDEALVRHMFGDAGYEAEGPPPAAPQPANLLKAVILLAQGEPVAAAAREAGCDPARVERLWAAMLHVLRTA